MPRFGGPGCRGPVGPASATISVLNRAGGGRRGGRRVGAFGRPQIMTRPSGGKNLGSMPRRSKKKSVEGLMVCYKMKPHKLWPTAPIPYPRKASAPPPAQRGQGAWSVPGWRPPPAPAAAAAWDDPGGGKHGRGGVQYGGLRGDPLWDGGRKGTVGASPLPESGYADVRLLGDGH